MQPCQLFAVAVLALCGLAVGCSPDPRQAIGRPVALLVVGDSLSAAHGMAPQEGWVSILEQQWKQEGFLVSGQEVVNASKSGETSHGGRERLAALLDQHEPSHLLLELGANDAMRRKPAQETIDNLKAMIQMAESKGIKVAITRIDLPTSWKFVGGSVVGDVVDRVEKDTDVKVIDFPLAGLASKPGMMLADNLHPSAAAQPILAERMKGSLAKFSGTP